MCKAMGPGGPVDLKDLGNQLGRYLQQEIANHPLPAALQAVVADLAADLPDLQAPLRDLVSRPTFQSIIPYAQSGKSGLAHRDALIEEISRIYRPEVVLAIGEVLDGIMGSSEDGASNLYHYDERRTKSMITDNGLRPSDMHCKSDTRNEQVRECDLNEQSRSRDNLNHSAGGILRRMLDWGGFEV